MGRPFIRAHFTFCIAICAFWLTSACCQEAAKQPKLSSEVERCRRINNEHMRVHRLEQINSKAAPVPQQQPTASGTWQLARTPNPSGGPDSISITKITNPTPSEQDVAGLMLRCAEGASTDRSSRTLPPRSHPEVTVVAGATTTEFIASPSAAGQPRKVTRWDHPFRSERRTRSRTILPLCFAVEWARYRAEDVKPA
jgi:hypothetical protein